MDLIRHFSPFLADFCELVTLKQTTAKNDWKNNHEIIFEMNR